MNKVIYGAGAYVLLFFAFIECKEPEFTIHWIPHSHQVHIIYIYIYIRMLVGTKHQGDITTRDQGI